MKRADRYRGKRPGSGLTAGQVAAMALITLAAVLVMTMKVSAQWCGQTCGEQLYIALFVAEDWD